MKRPRQAAFPARSRIGPVETPREGDEGDIKNQGATSEPEQVVEESPGIRQ